MMSRPQPARHDHSRFCEVEGWRRVRDAGGRSGTHHVTYEFDLPNGAVLRTRISHPVDRSDYGPAIWNHILRDQLQVDEKVFWACVRNGTRPDRGEPKAPDEALPADLVHLLINRVGHSESEVAAMTKAAAIDRLQRYWADGV
jgi:hypothetical protein